MIDIVTSALDRTVQSVHSGKIVSFMLPYVWAYGLCMAGKRVEYMNRLRENLAINHRCIHTVADGKDNCVLFITVPQEAQSN